MASKVLWVVKGLGPGGAENLLVAAAETLDHDQFEIECAYVLPWKDHLVADLERAGVRTRCLSERRADRRWPLRLISLIRDGSYDAIHIHSPLPGSVARLAARSMPRERRPRLISTEHNRWETHRLPTRMLNRLTSRWDDAAIAVTDEVRMSMRGPIRDRVTTVRHGIDLESTRARTTDRSDVRRELGLDEHDIVVGTVANFRPQKDYPNLLRAAAALTDTQVRFVAVGQGPDEAEIGALHAELDLGERCLLTGFRADAVSVMAGCDIFTIASKWEGLPVAVMEALALGLPIVATDVGGIAEEFTDGVDALLVPPGDSGALAAAIRRVATDDDLRARLAAASADKASQFDVSHATEYLETLYDRGATGESTPSTPTRPRRPPPAGVDVRLATDDDRDAVLALLGRSLGADADDPRYRALFSWKHDDNRFGPSPMWIAVERDEVIAFRAFMRWEFERGGELLRAVRAVDTATDPAHQGKGLFTLLTMHALDEMRADGVDFVFNTPNDQSRPGYLKMGWREVGHLPAAVRFSGPTGAFRAVRSKVPADRWSIELDVGEPIATWLTRNDPAERLAEPTDVRQIRTRADGDFLAWRYGAGFLSYRVVDDGNSAVIVRARRRGAATELALVSAFGEQAATDRLAASTAREVGADYVIRLGAPRPSTRMLPLPGGGPVLTWRAVNDLGPPPLANWSLVLGDVELF